MHCERLTEFGRLTAKQREVLQLVSESMTVKEIARELGVSPAAVEQRIRSLRGRFGPLSRAELSRLYRELAVAADFDGVLGQGRAHGTVTSCTAKPQDQKLFEREPRHLPFATPSAISAQVFHSVRFYTGLALGFALGIIVAAATFVSLALTLRLIS